MTPAWTLHFQMISQQVIRQPQILSGAQQTFGKHGMSGVHLADTQVLVSYSVVYFSAQLSILELRTLVPQKTILERRRRRLCLAHQCNTDGRRFSWVNFHGCFIPVVGQNFLGKNWSLISLLLRKPRSRLGIIYNILHKANGCWEGVVLTLHPT